MDKVIQAEKLIGDFRIVCKQFHMERNGQISKSSSPELDSLGSS